MFMTIIFSSFAIAGIISSIAILTDKTPDSAYEVLAGKAEIIEDWIHEWTDICRAQSLRRWMNGREFITTKVL